MDWQTGGSNQVPRRQAEIKKPANAGFFYNFNQESLEMRFKIIFFMLFESVCTISCIQSSNDDGFAENQAYYEQEFPEIKGFSGVGAMSHYDYIQFLNAHREDWPLRFLYKSLDSEAYLSVHALSKFEEVRMNRTSYFDFIRDNKANLLIKNSIIISEKKRRNKVEYFIYKNESLLIVIHHLENHKKNCKSECIDLIYKILENV